MISKKGKIVKFFPARKALALNKKQYINEIKQKKNQEFPFDKRYQILRYYDRYDMAGELDEHYFLQDLYVAQLVINSGVKNHYDIGSRIDGFLAHLLSAGIVVNMIDIRPLSIHIKNLLFLEGNATDMANVKSKSLNSLSSLHAIEHFGLGRYGDPIDADGWKKALKEYERVLSIGGKLYLSVPIGNENKLCFNAHRIFAPKTIVNTLSSLSLKEFVYIKDYQIIKCDNPYDYHENKDYLCGIFVFENDAKENIQK